MHAEIETEDDVVPLLRSDLVITPSPQSRGTRDVTDPVGNKTFALYDFEVSIARMLDGKRTAGAVITAANKLGIPVTLPTLRTFLSQLRAYQFIDTTAPVGDSTTWSPRRKWTAEARELYQSALRLLRAGRFDEARGYLDALVAADPDNEEIAPLRARIDAAAAGNPAPDEPFDELHTPASPVPFSMDDVARQLPPEAPPAMQLPVPSLGGLDTTEPIVATTAPPRTASLQGLAIDAIAPLMPAPAEAARPVRSPPPAELTAPAVATTPEPVSSSLSGISIEVSSPSAITMDAAAVPAAPEVTAPEAAPLAPAPEVTAPDAEPLPTTELPRAKAPAKKSKWPLALAAVVVLGLAGALLRPVDARVTMACELKPVPVATANTPRAGTVKQAEVQSGEFVSKGTLLARLETSLDDSAAASSDTQDALENELRALKPAPAAKVKKAKAALKKAEAAVKLAEKAAAKARGKKVAAAQKALAGKEAALTKAWAALDALTHEARRAELKAELARLDEVSAAATARLSRSTIEAPADGVVLLPELPVTLEENAAFAQLVESKLLVHTDAPLPEGATKATLKVGASERPVSIQSGKATVTLDPGLVNAKAELLFPGKKQPWVLTLLNR